MSLKAVAMSGSLVQWLSEKLGTFNPANDRRETKQHVNEQNSNKMHINLFTISTPTCFGPNGPSSGCYRQRIPNINLPIQCTVIVYAGE
jgi:hypothetical protein